MFTSKALPTPLSHDDEEQGVYVISGHKSKLELKAEGAQQTSSEGAMQEDDTALDAAMLAWEVNWEGEDEEWLPDTKVGPAHGGWQGRAGHRHSTWQSGLSVMRAWCMCLWLFPSQYMCSSVCAQHVE